MVLLLRSALANLIAQSAADVRHIEINPESDRLLGVNQTAKVDAIPPVTGLISQDGKTLILVADPVTSPAQYSTAIGFTPTVETVTFSNGDVHPQICHRSRVLISLPNGY